MQLIVARNDSNLVVNKRPEIVYTCKTTQKSKPKVTIFNMFIHLYDVFIGELTDYHESEIYFNRLYERLTALHLLLRKKIIHFFPNHLTHSMSLKTEFCFFCCRYKSDSECFLNLWLNPGNQFGLTFDTLPALSPVSLWIFVLLSLRNTLYIVHIIMEMMYTRWCVICWSYLGMWFVWNWLQRKNR